MKVGTKLPNMKLELLRAETDLTYELLRGSCEQIAKSKELLEFECRTSGPPPLPKIPVSILNQSDLC